MAVTVTTKQAFTNGNETTYHDGTAYDVDQYGHLSVLAGDDQVGVHAAGEWMHARTVELAVAGPGA